MNNKSKKFFGALALASVMGAALYALPVQADDSWEALVAPRTDGGLVLSPCIVDVGSGKPFLAWAGTGASGTAKLPEFTFSVLNKEWSDANMPFFGQMVNGVRCLALGMAKYTLCTVFQRNTEQSHTSFEVNFSGSVDKGWSFTKPEVADSFIHEDSAGTTVACAGVSGTRPMFAIGWLSEAKFVKVALWNPSVKMDRPRAESIGHYSKGYERLQLAGESKGGFLAAWSQNQRLMYTYLQPLVGTSEKVDTLTEAKVGMNFALTDYKGRNPKAVFEMNKLRKGEGARRQVWGWKDGKWERIPAAAPPKGERPSPARLEACQDEQGDVYVASLTRNGENILYSRLHEGKFSEPETAISLQKVLGVTGFDIAVIDKYVYVVASQGPYMHLVRKKIN